MPLTLSPSYEPNSVLEMSPEERTVRRIETPRVLRSMAEAERTALRLEETLKHLKSVEASS